MSLVESCADSQIVEAKQASRWVFFFVYTKRDNLYGTFAIQFTGYTHVKSKSVTFYKLLFGYEGSRF